MFEDSTTLKKPVSESADSSNLSASLGAGLSSVDVSSVSGKSSASRPPSGRLTADISSGSVTSAASRLSSDRLNSSDTLTSQR